MDRENVDRTIAKLNKLLNSVSSSAVNEVRSMPNPPEVVLQVLKAVFITLGYKEADFEQTRKEFKSRKFSMIKAITEFDYRKLTFKKCRQVWKILKDLDPHRVSIVSQG